MSKKQNTSSDVISKYNSIYVIISPPRCGSTAFARVFWQHPSIRYYSHEPFEITYYSGKSLDDVYEKLESPLDLKNIVADKNSENCVNLVIKDIVYQVGDNLSNLVSWAKKPVIFLIRDPRLNILSRIDKKIEVGTSPFFPLIETGWELVNNQINYCKQSNVPYIIVDSSDFRNHSQNIFNQVFNKLELNFSEEFLTWPNCHTVEIDNLDGAHTHLYKKVLSSTAIKPAIEPIPTLDDFPKEHGFRQHVIECLEIYKKLRQDSHRILPK